MVSSQISRHPRAPWMMEWADAGIGGQPARQDWMGERLLEARLGETACECVQSKAESVRYQPSVPRTLRRRRSSRDPRGG